MNKVHLFGYSGHAYVVIESLLNSDLPVVGYIDNSPANENPYKLNYTGSEKKDHLPQKVGTDFVFPAIGDNKVREKIDNYIQDNNLRTLTVTDSSASVSPTAIVQESTYIGKNVCVNAQATIGRGVILNTACVIEHECKIGDYVHIAPNTTLAGNVKVGKGSFVGAGAVIKQGVRIGESVTIGAGAVVINDIPDNETWVGNPAKRIK